MDCTSPAIFVIEIGENAETNQADESSEAVDANKTNEVKTDKSIKTIIDGCFQWIKRYVKKFGGLHEKRPKRLTWDEYLWSFIGAFVSIALVAILHYRLFQERNLFFLIASCGASAVIIFCNPRSPVAQPRSLIGGHLIGAICGCVMRNTIDRYDHSMACALSVSLSISIMQFTETLHPPGGATALLAVTIQPLFPWAHFLFVFVPALSGAAVMLLVALVVNNMPAKRTYPSFWW